MMRLYDDNEEEDDEEDLIVFKERQAPGFSLSQLTQKNSQHSQSQESLPRRPASRLISRQERRKRRNEWKERQLLDEEQFNSPELTAPETVEDAFESLKSLLPDSQTITPMPKTVQKQTVENEKENNVVEQKPRSAKASGSKRKEGSQLDSGTYTRNPTETSNSSNHRGEMKEWQSIDKAVPREANAAHEFDVHDLYQEKESVDCDEKRPETPKPRSDKQRSQSPNTNSFECDFESPIRPSKKRRKSRDNTSNHPKSASQRRQSTQSQRKTLRHLTPWTTSNSQSQTITETKRVKSIVGSRPSSWKKEPEKPLEWKRPRVSQKRSTPTFSSKSTQLPSQKAPSMSQIRAKYMPQPHRTRTSSSSSTSKRTTTSTPSAASSQSKQGSNERSKSPVSFLPTSIRRNDDDDVEEVREKPQRRDISTSSPLQATSALLRDAELASPILRSNRRTKKTIGPWQRRLEALQNARSNDAIRLQNEAFRRQASFEMKDYRKKSHSHTDITILGECGTSWRQNEKATQDASKICVLAYIHSHTLHHDQPQQQEKATLQHHLAWVIFTFLTARSINLQKGKQLRLYDSIILPCSQPTPVEGMAIDTLQSNVCERIIVSTWLCENHPKGLPKLSFGSCIEASDSGAPEMELP